MNEDRLLLDQLKRDDPDRWWTLLLTSPHLRPGLAALYAFNQELAKIRDQVSEPAMGDIRLQWWRESLDDLAQGQVRRHPVIQALVHHDVPARVGLDRLKMLVDARAQDLDAVPLTDFAAILDYAQATGGALQSMAMAYGGGDENAQAVADQVGRSWALVGLVRALIHVGPTDHSLFQGDAQARGQMTDLTRQMLDQARKDLQAARKRKAYVPRHIRPLLLLASLADSYMVRFGKSGEIWGKPGIFAPSSFALLKLYWQALVKIF